MRTWAACSLPLNAHSQLSRQSLWQWNSMESHVIQFSPGIELCEDMNDNVVGVFIPLMMGLSSATVRADMAEESFLQFWNDILMNTIHFFHKHVLNWLFNSLWPIDAIWQAKWIWVNIRSGNGLLPDGTKPLSKPMMTFYYCSLVVSTW